MKDTCKIMANQKRIESCRAVGERERKFGHERERFFLRQFNQSETVSKHKSYKAEADTTFDPAHPVFRILVEILNVVGNCVSNKGGSSIQLVLGRLEEIKISQEIVDKLNGDIGFVRNLFEKYLAKSMSDKPAHILAYLHGPRKSWIMFNMGAVVDFLCEKCRWRLTPSGRSIKGDIEDHSKKGQRQYVTIEFRKGKGMFLGFNGNKGKQFIELLMHPEFGIPHHIEEVKVSEAKI